jgi:hypothetical protein
MLILCLSGFVGCLGAALFLECCGVAPPVLLRFLWFMIFTQTILAAVAYRIRVEFKSAVAYRIREEVNRFPQLKESPRQQLLTFDKTVVAFLLDPPEPEKIDAKETVVYDRRVATAKGKLKDIIQENPQSDLTKYERTIGIKILSVYRTPRSPPDDHGAYP